MIVGIESDWGMALNKERMCFSECERSFRIISDKRLRKMIKIEWCWELTFNKEEWASVGFRRGFG